MKWHFLSRFLIGGASTPPFFVSKGSLTSEVAKIRANLLAYYDEYYSDELLMAKLLSQGFWSASGKHAKCWYKRLELKELLPQPQLMLKTFEGVYQNGKIELNEQPCDVGDRTQVLVTFLDPKQIDPVKLRQLIEQLETIAGIQQGFEELNAGQTRPISEFVQEMQQKYGISG